MTQDREAPGENIMGTQKISRLVLMTGLPLMLSLLINSLYNFVDSVFVAQVDEKALRALALAAPVQQLVSSFGLGNAIGLNAVISRAMGEKDRDKVRKAANASIAIGVCSWLLICLICLVGARPFFAWQAAGDEDIVRYGMDYLTICMYFSLGQMMQWVFDRFVIASGRSKLFLFTLSAASVTNLILDPIFILVLRLDTLGAAIATVIGQAVGAIAGILINRRWNPELPFDLPVRREGGRFRLTFDGRSIRDILRVGIPSTLVQMLTSVVTTAMNTILQGMNAVAVSVYGVAARIMNISTVGVHGIDNGLIPIVAYNYGAKKKERIFEALKWTLIYSAAFFAPFLLVLEIRPDWVLDLFNAEANGLLGVGMPALRILAVAWLVMIPNLVIAAGLQGLSLGTKSMTLTLLRQAILPLALAWALSFTGDLTLVWTAFIAAELISLPYALWLWKRSTARVLRFAGGSDPA